MYRHILIPTDGSRLAQRAVPHALKLAKTVGAKVTALVVEHSFNVYDVRESMLYAMPEQFAAYDKFIKEHARKILDKVARAAKAKGVNCTTLQVVHDLPYRAIVDVARKRRCDLIVMASHGRSGVSGLVLGSVTTKVLAHSKVPVLVLR